MRLTNSKPRRHDALELAWAAGLYDSEGSTFAYRMRTKYPRKGLRVAVGQHHNPEVLHRFRLAVGLGLVYGGPGLKKNGEPRKYPHQYCYVAHGPSAHVVLQLLWPYLSTPKKDQAKRAYRTWRSQ